MATKKKTGKKGRTTRRPTKAEQEKQQAFQRALIICFIIVALVCALLRLGAFGVTLYNMIRFVVGSLAYLVIGAILVYLFADRWVKKHDSLLGGFVVSMIGLLIEWHAYLFFLPENRGKEVFEQTAKLISSDLLHFKVQHFVGGGMLGAAIYKPIAFLFSNIGSFMIGGLFIAIGLFLMSSWDVYDLVDFAHKIYDKLTLKYEAAKQKRFMKREAQKEQKRLAEATKQAEKERLDELSVDLETGEILEDRAIEPFEQSLFSDEPQILDYQTPEESYYDDASQDQPFEEIVYDMDHLDETDDADVSVSFETPALKHYQLPSLDLFAPDKPKNQSKEKHLVRQNIGVLEETFKSFGIDVKVERAEIGPSVTKYEVKPAVGVRVNRISNLADDLALALAAKDVRIEAPIPGKSLVGIEVPNSEIATVSFRELWEQSKTDPTNLLEVPLGKAVNGSARSFNLARMPHLLVAGSTGSGKSVAVNGIISSILMKARPDQVKFLMIDPKMVELSVYNDIPHLLIPVVTNPRKASRALQKVVDEMEKRYELFSHFGVRNIASYNARVDAHNAQSELKEQPLPLIVVIVDELADLMMVASKEVEDAIIRLGQKARAAGIHMILATQRPSVDVISGLIKANVPSRVAFAVSSGTDSRTILDENGAEKLLGRGDMLFKPIDENHPVRLQGSFISDDDVERIVSFIKDQAKADYDESFDPGEVSDHDIGANYAQEDDYFEEAKALVIDNQKASAAMLQRRLMIGFPRATSLMEQLEAAGVIGPPEGTKPRKVLIAKEE
ncbi:DNA translocase FtsK [Streptococcus sp. zg-JUN1979]|uniref:FtsK/SpoIIIE family DNA translocase n=1 Tax=Streptococcus sp. zg-JUN1979 TaxID=3391450 RepID=UPI0039A64202